MIQYILEYSGEYILENILYKYVDKNIIFKFFDQEWNIKYPELKDFIKYIKDMYKCTYEVFSKLIVSYYDKIKKDFNGTEIKMVDEYLEFTPERFYLLIDNLKLESGSVISFSEYRGYEYFFIFEENGKLFIRPAIDDYDGEILPKECWKDFYEKGTEYYEELQYVEIPRDVVIRNNLKEDFNDDSLYAIINGIIYSVEEEHLIDGKLFKLGINN